MNKPTTREYIAMILTGIIAIAYFLNAYAYQQTITEYQNAYTECIKAYNYAADGKLPLYNGNGYYNNISINLNHSTIKPNEP